MKKFFVFVLLLVVAGYFWLQWGSSPNAPVLAAKVGGNDGKAPTTGGLPPSAVFRIDPTMSGASPPGAASRGGADAKKGQLAPAVSPLMADYLARKDFPGLMAKISLLPNDAEALFLRAQILETCALRTDQPANAAPRKTPAERRLEFLAKLPPNAPDVAQRTAAYDAAYADVCGPLRSMETTGKEMADLLARAQELKDPTALARDLNCEIFNSIDQKANGSRAAEINDSRFERIRQAIASRNPVAVRVGVGMLANNYRNGAFRIGPDNKPIDVRAIFHAANLLSCQYGSDCNVNVLRACANDGKCAANNFEDYLAFYELSPHNAQAVESYRALLTQMIDSGDFSGLQLVKGDQPTDSVQSGSYFSCAK